MLRNWKTIAVAAGLVLLGLAPRTTAGAVADHTNYLTFSAPVQLPGITLGGGAYVFEIADSSTSHQVVRVRSRDGRRPIYMGFTRQVGRPPGLARDAVVSLGESAHGVPPRVTAWYPVGEASGHQFIYPGR